jgi:hypothetical protein
MRSLDGRYFNILKNKSELNKINPNNIKYNQYLTKNINKIARHVHVDIFRSFVSNISIKDIIYINHIDGDRFNNIFINLEPTNPRHNILHAKRELISNQSIKIKKIDITTKNEIIYNSIAETAENNNLDASKLHYNLHKYGSYTDKNYKFQYIFADINYNQRKRIWIDNITDDFKQIKSIKLKNDRIIDFTEKNYYISKLNGSILKKINDKFIAIKSTIKYGYATVQLTGNLKIRINLRVNRLVLIVHLEGSTNRIDEYQDYTKLFVDHKNRIRNDNNIDNLRWVTPQENSLLSNGFKAIGIVKANKYSEEEFKKRKIEGTLEFDQVYADFKILAKLLETNTTTIQKSASQNEILFGNRFLYISDKLFQRFEKINKTLIYNKEKSIDNSGEYKCLNSGEINKFTSIQECNNKLMLEHNHLWHFIYHNQKYLQSEILTNGNILYKLKCTRIKRDNIYKLTKYGNFENKIIIYQDDVSSGKPKKCWIINENNSVFYLISLGKADEFLNLINGHISSFIRNNKLQSLDCYYENTKCKYIRFSIFTENGKRLVRRQTEVFDNFEIKFIDKKCIIITDKDCENNNNEFKVSNPLKYN